jgi:hypothetical protein
MKIKILLSIAIFLFQLNISFNSISQPWFEDWVRHENNPILASPYGTATWTDNFFQPIVLHDNNIYKMWFTGWIAETREIGYAESVDELNWEVHDAPVLEIGDPNDWDYWKISHSVLKINDTLHMWYIGSQNWANAHVGYAWSVDGINWYKNDDPVFPSQVNECAIYYDANGYHMYYCEAFDDIYYATSENGINWVVGNNGDPVIELGPPGSWCDHWVYPSGLIMFNDTLRMFLTGHDGTGGFNFMRTGYAWTEDYISWNLHDTYVLDVILNNDYESMQACSHTILYDSESKILSMWYTGLGDLNNWAVCLAKNSSFSNPNVSEIHNENIKLTIYPNPFTTSTTLSYNLDKPENIRFTVFNVQSQIVYTIEENQEKGEQKFQWNADGLPAGMYYFMLQAGEMAGVGKMVKMR